MKKLLLYSFLCILFLFSCKKEDAVKREHIYNQVLLVLSDESNNNFLDDSASSNALNDLNLFYVNKMGERVIQNNTNLDLPKNMEIVNVDGTKGNVLKIFANLVPQNDDFAESILEIEGYSEISIKVKIEASSSEDNSMSGSTSYSQVLINGEEISENVLGQPITVKLKK